MVGEQQQLPAPAGTVRATARPDSTLAVPRGSFSSGGFGVLTSLILLVALPAEAATYYVTVDGSSFSPATLTIEAGDMVV